MTEEQKSALRRLGEAVIGFEPLTRFDEMAHELATAIPDLLAETATQAETISRLVELEGSEASLLCDVAQLIDAVKVEWQQEGAWSKWDQSVRDRISARLQSLFAGASLPKTETGEQTTRLAECARDVAVRLKQMRALLDGISDVSTIESLEDIAAFLAAKTGETT